MTYKINLAENGYILDVYESTHEPARLYVFVTLNSLFAFIIDLEMKRSTRGKND